MECIFCRILAGEIPCQEVMRDEDFIAFRDINPKAPVHVLIVPRQHITDMNELAGSEPALAGRLFQAVGRVAAREGIAQSGYRVIVNCGPDGGQEVAHLHLHLLGGRPIGPMVGKS